MEPSRVVGPEDCDLIRGHPKSILLDDGRRRLQRKQGAERRRANEEPGAGFAEQACHPAGDLVFMNRSFYLDDHARNPSHHCDVTW